MTFILRYYSKIGILLLVGLNFFAHEKLVLNWNYVDFDVSLGRGKKYYQNFFATKGKIRPNVFYNNSKVNIEIIDIYRQIYKKNHFVGRAHNHAVEKIPKRIHQIWLGKKLPSKYKALQASWLKYHPNWVHILWVDNPINFSLGVLLEEGIDTLEEALFSDKYKGKVVVVDIKKFNIINKDFFSKAKTYGLKSDVLRYELLYTFGGLYIDIDFGCIKSFDILNESYEFYSGIAPLNICATLANGLIAAIPRHPILKSCIENMRDSSNKIDKIGGMGWGIREMAKYGPYYFTNVFLEVVQKYKDTCVYDNLIVFPPSYFYPLRDNDEKDLDGGKLQDFMQNFPESFAIHFWARSWIKD